MRLGLGAAEPPKAAPGPLWEYQRGGFVLNTQGCLPLAAPLPCRLYQLVRNLENSLPCSLEGLPWQPPQGWALHTTLRLTEGGGQRVPFGAVIVDPASSQIVVALRGTMTGFEWGLDWQYNQVPLNAWLECMVPALLPYGSGQCCCLPVAARSPAHHLWIRPPLLASIVSSRPCFRGRAPAVDRPRARPLSLLLCVTLLQTTTTPDVFGVPVHAGFGGAFSEVWPDIEAALQELVVANSTATQARRAAAGPAGGAR